ncbi:MAG: LamG-like jellyroll fold domain-containing protein [Armatimonadota bacterium]
MREPITMVAIVLAALAAVPALAQGQPFGPDAHTLLLAHFDDSPARADYANGCEVFSAEGAGLIDGYFGRALDTRGLQVVPDFMDTCAARLPRFVAWGFMPRGNVDFYQGTLEFWFRVSPDDFPQNHARQNIFFTNWFQPIAGKGNSASLTTRGLSWQWATLASEHMTGSVSFDPPLSPDDWHHFAQTWSQEEFVIYLDGRAVDARDMTGQYGLALVAQTHTPVMMNGAVIDELRISNVVRYTDSFEPAWRDGARPEYAIAGPGEIQRFDPKLEEPYSPEPLPAPEPQETIPFDARIMRLVFDRATGVLYQTRRAGGEDSAAGRNGLLLWRGVERELLSASRAEGWRTLDQGGLEFTQTFGYAVRAEHAVMPDEGVLRWEVTLTNTSAEELWLEALLSVPMPPEPGWAAGERLRGFPRDYFDMANLHPSPSQRMRRDDFVFSLPCAAVGWGQRSTAVGIDAHRDLSALVSEFIAVGAECVVRQGTKLALAPGESFTIPFVIVSAEGDFGALDAIDAYHALFPDLYRQRPEVPVYSYMPVCRYESFQVLPDLWRQTMMGELWGHGPAFAKGFEWGTQEYWDLPVEHTEREDYNYVARLKRLWGTLQNLHQQIIDRSARCYNEFYTPRRSHYCPNWTNRFIVERIWPEGMLGGDPLVAGQYYDPMYWCTNEYHTPIGENHIWQTRQIMEAIAGTTPGFINDMCQTSPWRFTDDMARRTPGRAWARDRGEYLVGAFGHANRYRTINDFRDARGFAQSVWSDGGVVSYMLSAHSAADAVESGVPDVQLFTQELGWRSGRMLLGEKPLALHFSKEGEYLGRWFEPEDFTPESLREWYRYGTAQVQLMALKHGMHLPFDCVIGQQEAMELHPLLVESIVRGRKLVPGAWVGEAPGDIYDHVFVRRAGEGLDTLLVVGNELPRAVSATVTCDGRYFGGSPVFGASFGGEVREAMADGLTLLSDVTVGARSMAGLRCLGRVLDEAGGPLSTTFAGDGITMTATIAGGGGRLEVADFAPLYAIASVTRNGAPIELTDGCVALGGEIEITWRNRALDFGADDWARVDLVRDGQPRFCVIANTDTPYRAGTAGMLNQFLEQYDTEDGVLGNLPAAAVGAAAPPGFDGWQVLIDDSAQVDPARVRIEAADRRIVVEGRTPGEARRALMILLRMVDRKYPHIGRLFPLKYYDVEDPWSKLSDEETKAFFAGFEDPKFLVKPILSAESEDLYAGGNLDFTGKYHLRFTPWIYEPTYADDYVYGYEG